MRSAGEQKRDRTTNLHCSKLSPNSQTSNVGWFHRSNSALRQTITLCKTWIGDQYPSNSGGDPIRVELRAGSTPALGTQSFHQFTAVQFLAMGQRNGEVIMAFSDCITLILI